MRLHDTVKINGGTWTIIGRTFEPDPRYTLRAKGTHSCLLDITMRDLTKIVNGEVNFTLLSRCTLCTPS